MTRRKQPELKIVANFMRLNGELKEMTMRELLETDLPDRCKLALAEIITGQKYELVQKDMIQ